MSPPRSFNFSFFLKNNSTTHQCLAQQLHSMIYQLWFSWSESGIEQSHRERREREGERESRSIRILVVGPNSRSRRRQRLDADLNIESHRLRTIIYLRNSDDGSNTSRRPYVRTCSTKFGRKEYKTFSNFSWIVIKIWQRSIRNRWSSTYGPKVKS